MFSGNIDITLDERGRMAMPMRYRDSFRDRSGGRLVITVARHDPCLDVYAECDWEVIFNELAELDDDDLGNRRRQLKLIGSASEVELDANGRVVIPQRLRDYADLEKKAVVVGLPGRLQLWNDEKWDRQYSQWRADANRSLEEG